jgi:hypothetical protein
MLTLRRQASPRIPEWDRDRFWSVFYDGVRVGVIVLQNGAGGDPARWHWHVNLHAGRYGNGMNGAFAISGQADILEEAMAAFRRSFDQCLPHIGEAGWTLHVDHTAEVDARLARWRRQKAGTEPGGLVEAPGGRHAQDHHRDRA